MTSATAILAVIGESSSDAQSGSVSAEGLKFTSYYAPAANCSPCAPDCDRPHPGAVRHHRLDSPAFAMHLKSEEVTIAACSPRGYATALVGKWHLNGGFDQADQPQPGDHGFDFWFATQNIALPNHRNPTNFYRNGTPVGPMQGYSAEIIGAEATHWLEIRDKAKPFFLYVAFHEPHEPIATAKRYVDLYPSTAPSEADFNGNITQFDDAFGRLMHALDAQGLRQNTLVFFTSDNGPAITPMHPHGSAGPLQAKRASV